MCKKCGVNKCSCGPTKVITERGTAGKSFPSLRGKQGPAGPAGPSGDSSLTIKNTAFVAKNGNDSTGLVERLDKPFLTVQAAISALTSLYPSRTVSDRKQVFVFDGIYNESITLKSFVDIHFYDVYLNGTISDGNTSLADTNDGEYTNVITGNLKLHKTSSGTDTAALFLYKPKTKLLMYADLIASDLIDTIVVNNGILDLYCPQIVSNDTGGNYNVPLELGQGYLESDYTFSRVRIYGADFYRKDLGVGPIILFSAGSDFKNQTLELHDCRLKNTQSNEIAQNNACINVGGILASNAVITMYNTVLYSHSGNSIYTETGQVARIKCYHSNMSNVAHGGGGTNNFLLGSITVNSAVEAEF